MRWDLGLPWVTLASPEVPSTEGLLQVSTRSREVVPMPRHSGDGKRHGLCSARRLPLQLLLKDFRRTPGVAFLFLNSQDTSGCSESGWLICPRKRPPSQKTPPFSWCFVLRRGDGCANQERKLV